MTDRRAFLSILGIAAAEPSPAQNQKPSAKFLRDQPLPPPFTGWTARFVEVQFPAGLRSDPHVHPGFVLGYVVEGEFRFALNQDSPVTLRAGEAFYEPPGARHTTGESAHPQHPAKILAIIVAPKAKA